LAPGPSQLLQSLPLPPASFVPENTMHIPALIKPPHPYWANPPASFHTHTHHPVFCDRFVTSNQPGPVRCDATHHGHPSSQLFKSTLPLLDIALKGKVFTKEAVVYSLDYEPDALLDCLIEMALNKVLIPIKILTMDSLNRIETNQAVKYNQISYGSSSGKMLLNKAFFPSKDHLNDFKFNQVS